MDALTTTQVAQYCGVHFRTVIRWITKGLLAAYQLPGRGDNRVRIQDLANFMLEHDMPIPEELLDRLALEQERRGAGNREILFCSGSDRHNVVEADLLAKNIQLESALGGFELGFKLANFEGLIVVDLAFFNVNPFEVVRWLGEYNLQKRYQFLMFERSRLQSSGTLMQEERFRNCTVSMFFDVYSPHQLVPIILSILGDSSEIV